MYKRANWLPLVLSSCLFVSSYSHADVSVTVTAASDYLFNGISQTDENPAIQASLDWANEQGWYAGSWASNVDFGDETDAEIDYYGGFSNSINQDFSYDVGLAYYSYVGSSESSDINYTEVYLAVGYQATQVKAWYTDDYAGTDAGHYIIALSHTFDITEQATLTFQIDRSTSLDDDKFTWDTNEDSYIHAKAETAFSWQSVDFTLGVEKTDLNYDDDVKVLGTASYTFSF